MTNKVEILRAIVFTKEDVDTIQNLGDEVTDKDIEFMVEFKKIYELGLGQLKKFIDKIDQEGDELDTYSINYYISVLVNGPLGSYVREFSKDKKFFLNTPDTLGTLGNKNSSSSNNTVFIDMGYPIGCSVDTYNKLPLFIQSTLQESIKITEDIFRSSLKSSSEIDNTLPQVDKNPQLRYDEEFLGKWVLRSNGTYMVKDRFNILSVEDSSQAVFEKVQEFLGEDNFRIYRDKKQYNAFDSEKNVSKSSIVKVEKKYTEGNNTEIITTDLMGDEFDSEEKRKSALVISSVEKDEKFLLNTNEGQLGDTGVDNYFN